MDITIDRHDAIARVRVTGDIDSETAPRLESALSKVLMDGSDELVLDLAEVSFLSSAGLGVLIGIHRDAQRFRVERGNRIVDRVIELTGLGLLYGDDDVPEDDDMGDEAGLAVGDEA